MIDWTGCLRIAALQHATTLGFAVAAVAAAFGTAEEASSGALSVSLLCEPRAGRLALVKIAALFLVLLASTALSALTLLATGKAAHAVGRTIPVVSRSSTKAMITDVGAALPVLLLLATLAVALALVLRSAIATIVTTVALFVLPLGVLDLDIFWITPTRWVIEWLHLDPFGEGVDYLANNSPYDHRGVPAVFAGLAILLTIVAVSCVVGRLVQRAAMAPSASA